MNRGSGLSRFSNWIRTHRLWIHRIICAAVIAALLVWVLCASASIIQADKERAATSEVTTKSPIKSDNDRDYGEAGFRRMAENDRFVLSADTTNGQISLEDKSAGEIWYSNPQGVDSKVSRLSAQLMVTVIDVATGGTSVVDNYAASINRGCMDWEKVDNGIRFVFSFPKQGLRIPVVYTLTDGGLQASVQADQIEELWSEVYLLQGIDLLPFFGAGGLDDEGYLFVPDGSGAIVNFNNGKERFSIYNQMVYGSDNMVVRQTGSEPIQQISMPVFGIRKNRSGFLAVITDGAAEAGIKATVSKKSSDYNQVYSYMLYRNTAFHEVSGSSALLDEGRPLFEDNAYTVAFFFLEEKDADYTGMANRYRQYLEDSGQLRQNQGGSGALALDVYGAVSLEQYVMGVKKNVITPLTTYEELSLILQECADQGLNDLVVQYIGALKGGLQSEIVTSFEREGKLGSQKSMNTLIQNAQNAGTSLFFQWDPINLYKSGNGFQVNRDSVRTHFEAFAYQYNFKRNTLTIDQSTRWYLMKPAKLPNLIKDYSMSCAAKSIGNIGITEIGGMIYSDYDTDKGLLSRNFTLKEWKKTLQTARDQFDQVLLDGSNAYGYPYADILVDVPMSGTDFDMMDASVPFLQIALRSSIRIYGGSLNFSSDYQQEFLRAVETGCGIKYSVIYGDITPLINTSFSNLVACNYDKWKETIFRQAKELEDVFRQIEGQNIVAHDQLASGVTKTTYGNGVQIVVNYNDAEYTDGSLKVPGQSYHMAS